MLKLFIVSVQISIISLFQFQNTFAQHDIAHRVIMIGDAGEPDIQSGEPVLIALEKYAKKNPENTTVIFLGDNIYPNGLKDIEDPDRTLYEQRIDAQISVITNSKSSGYFISGNHDWDEGSIDGIKYIKEQENYINSTNYNLIKYLPKAGCPGPEVIDINNNLNIIFLDTQWWLQDHNLSIAKNNNCDCLNEDNITAKIDSILILSQDKTVLIAGHHPLKSYGTHGGYFNLISHIFPLTFLNDYLLIPLPIIGSIYPIARNMGISNQDVSSSIYKNFISEIENIFLKYSNIIYAAGHEHNLQILKGANNNIYLISGAGIYNGVDSQLGSGEDAIYTADEPGFMVLDFYKDKRIKLSVIEVIDESGKVSVSFSKYIKDIKSDIN